MEPRSDNGPPREHLSDEKLLCAVLEPESLSSDDRAHLDLCEFCREIVAHETTENPVFARARSAEAGEHFWTEVKDALLEIEAEEDEPAPDVDAPPVWIPDVTIAPPAPALSGMVRQLVNPLYEISTGSPWAVWQNFSRMLFAIARSPWSTASLRNRRALVASYPGCFSTVARTSLANLMEVDVTSDPVRLGRAISGEEHFDAVVLDTSSEFVFDIDFQSSVRVPILFAGDRARIEMFLRVVGGNDAQWSILDEADGRLAVALRVNDLLESATSTKSTA